MNSKPPHLIICGTGTDVGKTIVSSLFVQGLEGIYWKPIQSGLEGGGDTKRICDLLNLPKERYLPEAYKFKAPVSPHWAAEKENQLIHQSKLTLPLSNKPLIIETAGGLMVPLNRQLLQIDQIKKWDLPIVLVAKSGLGTLNHTLLSIEALNKRSIPILGLVLNGPSHEDNPKTLKQLGNIPVLAELPQFKTVSPEVLQKEWLRQDIGTCLRNLLEK
ncbi:MULTISPECIES: dethiobiotin synthase [Prochlorococcus]|uniref:dethiobiotin synthase n=1 Tax=Prochlorococcus TaxID=1218 RepID=UPI000567D26C|nr:MULTISPECIES: dethiobiotin synthase [Prochlorococcus]